MELIQHSVNSFEQPLTVDIRSRQLAPHGQNVQYTFPAHSLTVLRLRLA